MSSNWWVSKWGGPTVDVTILKEIYYSTYLPNDISCTGNDTTVGCKGLAQFSKSHNPHWIPNESCSVIGRVSVVPVLSPVTSILLFDVPFGLTKGSILVIFQNKWKDPVKVEEHSSITVLPVGAITWDDGQGPLIITPELLYTGLVQVCPSQR